jgi:hypothetical protein
MTAGRQEGLGTGRKLILDKNHQIFLENTRRMLNLKSKNLCVGYHSACLRFFPKPRGLSSAVHFSFLQIVRIADYQANPFKNASLPVINNFR